MKRTLGKLCLVSLVLTISGPLFAQASASAPQEGKEKKMTPPKKAAAAAPSMAAQAPKPDPEMSQLKYFIGTWACKGMNPSTSLGPEHPTTATVRLTQEMGGFWIMGRYEEAKTKENPM